jgi:hypothetical protein
MHMLASCMLLLLPHLEHECAQQCHRLFRAEPHQQAPEQQLSRQQLVLQAASTAAGSTSREAVGGGLQTSRCRW